MLDSNYTTAKVLGDVQYRYYHVPPAAGSDKPYILFLHGCPSSSWDWRHQLDYFTGRGYGVIAPDLLGYGGTDKPADLPGYRGKKMTAEVAAILDRENVAKVVGVGHDWGSHLLSRMVNYYPDRFLAFAFLSIMYSPPGGHFDLDAANAAFKQAIGFEAFGYWKFFNSPDAGQLMLDNFDSTWCLFYPEEPEIWREHLAPVGAFRDWLTAKKTTKMASFVTEEEKQKHRAIFSPENGGYDRMLNWYRSTIANVNEEDEKTIPEAQYEITHPTLLITAARDPLALTGLGVQHTREHIAEDLLEIKPVDTGHWVQLEAAQEVNAMLEDFITRKAKNARI
ncbi:MAG: hypothetical protein M4579_004042 [Chaenotheca gracillima]|nr:MAG: hypothetical protein M4579_004042 [Chaenotheca gracillima]